MPNFGKDFRRLTEAIRIPDRETYSVDSTTLTGLGCPPGIRTPIERVRVASPTIEREGNTDKL